MQGVFRRSCDPGDKKNAVIAWCTVQIVFAVLKWNKIQIQTQTQTQTQMDTNINTNKYNENQVMSSCTIQIVL